MGVIEISRYTIDISGDIENKLKMYMKENKIKLKSVGIKQCIKDATDKENGNVFLIELDKKLNRIIYKQNINKKLLEQLFVNMGFQINEQISKDKMLEQFYIDNNNYVGRFD